MYLVRTMVVLAGSGVVGASCARHHVDPACPYNAALRSTIAAEFSTDTGAIVGRVLSLAAEPLDGARVELSPDPRVTEVRSDGAFRFEHVAAGTYTLVARRVGYGTARERVRVLPDGGVRVVAPLGTSVVCLTGTVP